AAIHADFKRIEIQHLPAEVRRAAGDEGSARRYRASQPDADERASIETALSETGGVVSRAAELLGMGRTTLWRKLKAYGLGGDLISATDDAADSSPMQ
ncbi:MAG: helix-turn-helix domain-containing protein, partial [Gemmatimonadales bacterium]